VRANWRALLLVFFQREKELALATYGGVAQHDEK
jgi:hypothetical protein